MNAEKLEIARRLVACKGWVWVPGMRVCFIYGPGAKTIAKGSHFGRVDYRKPTPDDFERPATAGMWLPDLDDDLTRLGVLAVVRRAWGMPHCGLWGNNRLGPSLRWACGEANGRIFTGETELLALLAALEAAP